MCQVSALCGFTNAYATQYEASLERGGAYMYAIIETGGKQYKVSEGDVVFIEKLNNEVGDTVCFDKVLAVSKDEKFSIGNPMVANAKVDAKILSQGKDKKIVVFKYKSKKGYSKKQGHRQPHTKVQIEKINA